MNETMTSVEVAARDEASAEKCNCCDSKQIQCAKCGEPGCATNVDSPNACGNALLKPQPDEFYIMDQREPSGILFRVKFHCRKCEYYHFVYRKQRASAS